MTTSYSTPLKQGSWSVVMTEHGHGGVDHEPQQVGSYEADQGRLGEIAKGVMGAYDTRGGSQEPQWTRGGVSPVTRPAHNSDPNGRVRHASVTMYTPEGHRLRPEHVQGIMSGTHDAQDLREQYADDHEVRQQHDFEDRVRKHIALHGGLPHSGIDAMMAGVPTADSPAGSMISAGIVRGGSNGGTYHSGNNMPHHSGDTSLENPAVAVQSKRYAKYQADQAAKAASPQDRGGDGSRVVDHR